MLMSRLVQDTYVDVPFSSGHLLKMPRLVQDTCSSGHLFISGHLNVRYMMKYVCSIQIVY